MRYSLHLEPFAVALYSPKIWSTADAIAILGGDRALARDRRILSWTFVIVFHWQKAILDTP